MSGYHFAVAAGAAIVVAASAAAAAPAYADTQHFLQMSTNITIEQVGTDLTGDGHPAHQRIKLTGIAPMSEANANDWLTHGYHIYLRYWGDDTNSDDLLVGPRYPKNVYARPDGLHFDDEMIFNHMALDEDSGAFEDLGDGGTDEIYVGARAMDPHSSEIGSVESNRIEGRF